ncbi:MAG: glycoside hydrolase family 78 protein [Bacteroidales bacterium]|jgi:alpha-L-rhamnosidase|nr:glycoside hydrolase family 78 protein [Bacteroidales bacterium]
MFKLTHTILIIHILFLFYLPVSAQVHPVGLTCEYLENPLGIDITAPVLGWKLQSNERGQLQTAYEIMVATSEDGLEQGKNLVWKSGKKTSAQSNNIAYAGQKLQPFTRYYWKVRVYDRDGKPSVWSVASRWETAMLTPADWKAQWIGDGSQSPINEADFYRDEPAPMFRKTFTVKKQVVSARLYITGLGYYEAYINGDRVGNSVLDPGWTNFGKQALYSVYDITGMIRRGDNAIGAILGNGFYNPLPMRIFKPLREYLYIGRPCLKAQLRVTYTGGSMETITTDNTWKTAPSAIMRNNVYLGERYDARMETPGWNLPEFKDNHWKQASLAVAPSGELTAQMQPPIRITKTFRPVRMTESRPGVFVFDMGQNFAGVVRIRVQGPRGAKITIRYGEDVYSDGSLNVMTSVAGQQKRVWDADREASGQPQTAWQEDSYTLRGEGEETWSPRFTFHGFRYVEVTGWPGRPSVDHIEGLRMNADLLRTGQFECSNPMFNQLNAAIDHTFLSNVFSVQSDCPAREKFGYGGDIVGVARTFGWFYDMENFYRKVIRDFAGDQRPLGGMTETAPYNGIADQGLGDGSGPIGWQLAFAFLQKQLYEYYGDTRTIETYYSALRKQVEFLRANAQGHIIDRCINDHESLEERIPALFATAHYYHHVILLAEFATLTGRAADAQTYSRLAADIKAAFMAKFVKSGEVGNHTQAAQAFGLYYNLLPDADRNVAFNVLLREIALREGHIAAGIFGVPLILETLTKNDRNDIAYEMVDKKTFPGWGHMLQSGATTVWETWKYSDNVYSQNHPMFGSVGEWFYQALLGINPAAPGFKRVVIKPQPAGDLTWARGSFESIQGTIGSSWKIDDGRFLFDVAVPVNTVAEIWVPSNGASAVTESGKPAKDAKGLKLIRHEKDYAIFEAGSGKYQFVSEIR